MTAAPIDLFGSCFHLHQRGEIHREPWTVEADRGGWQIRTLHAKTNADVRGDHWEIHPEAERLVACLIGKIRLYLRSERFEQPEEEIRLRAGTAAIVPRGRWHRVSVDVPSSILAVT
jgi:mannose-6-phosphate isomerase-like protein (cupin superfamily)